MYSKLASPTATRAMLDEFGLRAKYKLGQNFLIDDHVIGHILELADLQQSEAVVEVGPGMGTLTCALLPRVAAVVAFEADSDMRGPLSVSCADYSERLALVQGDALRMGPEVAQQALAELSQKGQQGGVSVPHDPDKLVSNLPYAVAAKLILLWMQTWPALDSMTVMVQAEVADRISAEVGTKAYGAYTVKLALLARVTDRFEVPHTCFMPAPHVESAVLRLDRLTGEEALSAEEAQRVSAVVDGAFAQRRKTVRNSLSRAGCPRDALDGALEAAHILGTARAETLTPFDFVRLTRELQARTGWPR